MSSYRGVTVYAVVESRDYYDVVGPDKGNRHFNWRLDGIAHHDEASDIIGWNVFGADGKIDYSLLDIKRFPSLGAVEKLIDYKLKEIEYYG